MQSHKKYFHIPILLSICIFPMVIGWLLFYYHDHFHFKQLNFGNLIIPVIRLPNDESHKWCVLYVSEKKCDASCERIEYFLHQIQKAQGKNQQRLMVLRLTAEDAFVKTMTPLLNHHYTQSFIIHNKIYLMDPLGNLFMYYPSNTPPMHILKDIKKVLEVSQIG